MTGIDERLSVHDVTFLGATVDELCGHWQALGVRRLSLLDTEVADRRISKAASALGCSVNTVYHLFTSTEGLRRVIDDAATAGARAVYMLTGGRDGLSWEDAADRFCTAVQPCLDDAHAAGLDLAIENASGLYADIHIAHTLADTIDLAERAGLGVCIDLFHCWTEAHLAALIERALPRTVVIQVSDYVLGDRALPARAVPGDGAIPLEDIVAHAIDGGYSRGFDLELIGPRIDGEGRRRAARRACGVMTTMLSRLDPIECP